MFAAVDAALQAAGEVRLRSVATEGKGALARTAQRLLEDRARVEARYTAGRVLCTTTATVLSALAFETYGIAAAILAGLGCALLYAMIAEVLRTIVRQRASRIAVRLVHWLRPVEILLIPFAFPVAAIGRLMARAVPKPPEPDSERMTELAVEQVIEAGQQSGGIPQDHADLLRSVLEFKNTLAHEVMVPRTQAVAIEIHTPIEEMIALIVESGHSRYPVYRETIDHVEGILYAKDLFSLLRKPSEVSRISVTELIRKPVCFVAETQKIGACLREMQERGVHLALVVDEFGGTAGVVTLEDILEEIVGEIRDEHDVDEVRVEEIGPGRYLADAGMSVYDLMDVLGEPITEQENNGEYDSLGGLVTALAGRVPRAGETVRVGGYDLLVREADERRVIRVEVMKRAITEMPPEPVPEEPAGATG